MSKTKKKETLTLEERLQAALVPDWEQLYKVPENWCWVRLGSSINLYNGDRGSNYPSKKDYRPKGIPFINAGAIVNGALSETEFNYISEGKYNALRAGKIQQGDILYCLRGSLGKTAIVHQQFKGAISSSLCILRTNESLLKEFLYYLLYSNVISHQQDLAENGSAQPNLSAASVMEYMIPLPPLSEQERIVDRIESLFAKLDEAKQKAQDALDSFETRKAAILHKAFTGELTAQWRKDHPHEKIEDKYLLNPVADSECPCELPITWKWVRMGSLGYTNIGLTYKPSDISKEGTIVLRSSNIQNGQMDYQDIVRVSIDIPDNKMSKKGDILICARNGSKALVGKVAVINKDGMSYGAFMAIFRSEFNSAIYYFLNSPFFRNIIDKDVGTTTINQVTQAIIKNLPYPLAPRAEQEEIVRILDDLLAKERQAKEAAEAVLEQIDLIKKSILARAFRGELGTNDPTEESAVELVRQALEKSNEVISETKARANRVVIPGEIRSVLSNSNEEEIIRLLMKFAPEAVSMQTIMSISKKKFELIDALRNLEKKQLVLRTDVGEYLLTR